MPKTTPNKKARKPTLIQRIAELEHRTGWLNKRLMDLESRLPPQEQEPEKWVPKAGDWAFVTMKDWSVMHHNQVRQVTEVKGDSVWLGLRGHFDLRVLRPATPQEIAAHKEAEVERKRKEQEAAKLESLEFGTPVNTANGKGLYLTTTSDGYIVAHKDGCTEFYELKDITIITP